MKVKLNESQLLKFYQVKQLKENSIDNSAEKKLCRRLAISWTLKHFYKTKKKRKIPIQRNVFLDTLSDKFQKIALKFATLSLFYPFLSCFFCIKFLLKNFIVCVNLFESVSELESCGTYCLNLPFELTV